MMIEPDTHDQPDPLEGRKLLFRLVVAFLCIATLTVGTLVILPLLGIYLPAWVPLAAFGVIAIAVLTNAHEEGYFHSSPTQPNEQVLDLYSTDHYQQTGCACNSHAQHHNPPDSSPPGRPIGCCPGPRPPRFLSKPDTPNVQKRPPKI